MRSKILFFIIVSIFVFCFFILFIGLKKEKKYIPNKISENQIPYFETKTLFSEENINSDQIFIDGQYYLINIWSSWCAPCKKEHPRLIELSRNSKLKLIGINYKDKINNAKNFIDMMGNPYSMILNDNDGIISIELGAYGVPETFIVDNNRKIIKKFIGPLDNDSIKNIKMIIK